MGCDTCRGRCGMHSQPTTHSSSLPTAQLQLPHVAPMQALRSHVHMQACMAAPVTDRMPAMLLCVPMQIGLATRLGIQQG